MRKSTRDSEQLLYSVSDVARMIGFGRSKTYDMIRDGKIPHIVIEGRIRIKREDLLAWIDGGSQD